MAKQVTETITHSSTNRRYKIVATVVVFGIGVVFLLYCPWWSVSEVQAPPEPPVVLSVQGEIMSESLPIQLQIPKLDIDVPFSEPLGLKPNQEVEVPNDYTSVGYYKNGPTPGELGPAVILGHVDSVSGPAVFFSLGQLEKDDEIRVERADGSVAIFAVTKLERHSQAGFPTKEVYGDINHAGLRLITCSGIYIKDATHYTHNLIVFAELVGTASTTDRR
ncbi:MAG: class F sortase [Patescibacteria group bacterium]